MLQMDPKLDPERAKQILQQTARTDVFTGAVPNPQWGYGKIDALAALNRLADSLLRITHIARTDGSVQLSFTSVLGKSYRVEFKDDLNDGAAWSAVANYASVPGTGLELTAIDGSPTPGRRFYRVASLP